MKRMKIQTMFLYFKCRYEALFKTTNESPQEGKKFRFMYLINPLMTGGPINEFKAVSRIYQTDCW